MSAFKKNNLFLITLTVFFSVVFVVSCSLTLFLQTMQDYTMNGHNMDSSVSFGNMLHGHMNIPIILSKTIGQNDSVEFFGYLTGVFVFFFVPYLLLRQKERLRHYSRWRNFIEGTLNFYLFLFKKGILNGKVF